MQALADIDFAPLTQWSFHPSPAAWEHQVFSFFLLDRIYDGNEARYRDNAGNLVVGDATPLLQAADHGNTIGSAAEAAYWREAGARFAGGAPLALNALTLGIPCIHYGSEQGLDGEGGNERYIREAMFGGDFGAFRSRGRHGFDESHSIYVELARLLAVRLALPAAGCAVYGPAD